MRKLKGFTLIELMIVVAIIGILAALAIPNFMRFQAKSKQSEAKANLKSIFTAEKSYAAEKDEYGTTFNDIGFEPERGNRYAYYLGAGTPEQRNAASITAVTNANVIQVDTFKYSGATAEPVFAAGSASPTVGADNDNFTAQAAGDIDSEDSGVDSWEISTISTITETATCGNNGEAFVAGSPYNTYNDVSCDG